MLLRHNPSLKKYYKFYSDTKLSDNNINNEYIFAMNFKKFWKFLKEIKVTNSKVTIAAIHRLFLQGNKNNYDLINDLQITKKKIEILKTSF